MRYCYLHCSLSKDSSQAQAKEEPPVIEKKKVSMPKPQLTQDESGPTKQKNESILAEAIFSPNVTVVPVEPRQTFQESYAALPQLSLETYREYEKDVKHIDRLLVKEEMAYYNTAMLWLRLINVKSKQGLQALSRAERTILKDLQDEVFNVPQPLYTYLMSIGAIVDKMGKKTYLQVPPLPTARAGGYGGYHSAKVDEDTHTLFEEVPSLGVAGDLLMAVASADDEPIQNYRVMFPANATYSDNFLGRYPTIGPRRMEVRQKLAGFGITNGRFEEYVEDTRFNRQYIRSISDRLGTWDTFRVEQVCFSQLSAEGLTVQAITSRPIEDEPSPDWLKRTVQGFSPEDDSAAVFGAATVFLFQLYKG